MALVDDIVSLYSTARTYYRPIRQDHLKYYKQYRSWLDMDTSKEYYKWRSKLFIPATARAVDGLMPDLLLTLFGQIPFFQVWPRNEEAVGRAEAIQALLSYQFDEADFFNKFATFLKQQAVYGTSFGKIYWKKEVKNVRRKRAKTSENGASSYQVGDEVETVFEGPVFEPIEDGNLTFSSRATSLEDTWVIHRTERSVGELKALEKAGIYSGIDDLEALIEGYCEEEQDKLDKLSISGLPSPFSKEPGDKRRVELLEYWNEDRSKICTIAGRLKVIREDVNRLYIDPFVRGTLWDIPFEMLGIGVPERVCDLQDQLNAEVNQRLDNRSLKQNFILKVRRGANVNTRSLISKPGAVWLTDDLTAIEPVSIPDVETGTSFAEENLLKQEIEEVTGVTKYAVGSGAEGGKKTATEVSVLSRMGSKSFALLVKRIEEQCLRPIIKKFYQLDELFMSKERVVRIVGPKGSEFQTVSPDEVRGDFDFIPAASSQLINKDVKVQQMIQMLGVIKDDPTVSKGGIYKKIWELWGYKDFDALFPPAPPPPMSGLLGGLPGAMGMGPTMKVPTPQGGGELRPPTRNEGLAPIAMPNVQM